MYIYFLLSKCEFLSDKKKLKPLKIKMWLQFFKSYSLLFLVSHLGGRGDTAVYETGFFSKRKAELLYLTYMHSMSLIALICFYSATTR